MSAVTDWMAEGSCRGKDPGPWFPLPAGTHRPPKDVDLYTIARAVCAGCPVRPACLDYALAVEAQHIKNDGMWGGLDEAERKKLRKARDRKRPNHGTAAGYKQHGRLGEKACEACTEANRARQGYHASRVAS